MIYFDHASTSKCKKEVLDAFIESEESNFYNPNSLYKGAILSSSRLNKDRELILNSLSLSKTHKVIFTSGASEANNLAIFGYTSKYKNRGNKIITSCVEHPSVLECFKTLEKRGFAVIYLPVNNEGKINIEDLNKNIDDKTILVSIMAVNNESGSINDISKIAAIVRSFPKCVFHSDITQAIGKVKLDYSQIDMLSYSAHKIGGIKGSGALLMKKSLSVESIIYGGGQEDGLRSGTSATSLDHALAIATSLAISSYTKNIDKIEDINSYIRKELLSNSDLVVINSPSDASPFILNFSLLNKKGAVLVEALSNEDVYVSSISACHSKKEESSYVIKAMFNDEKRAHNTIRLSFDETNTIEEAQEFIEKLFPLIRSIK